MAERRMFAKTIIDSDAFLDMPQSTQLLYFHLSMRADDDGFINNPKNIMRMVGCKEDDLAVLSTKKFIIPFESGVVVIKHWKIHNYIQKDRYHETKYKEEKSLLNVDENNVYTKCIQDGYEMDTQVRLGKVRLELGKDSIDDIQNIAKSYEENLGLLTPASAELLYSYLDTFTEDIICSAIKIASINNKRTTKYVCGILNDWKKKGLTTLLDIEKEQQEFKNRNQVGKRKETEEERLARKLRALEG